MAARVPVPWPAAAAVDQHAGQDAECDDGADRASAVGVSVMSLSMTATALAMELAACRAAHRRRHPVAHAGHVRALAVSGELIRRLGVYPVLLLGVAILGLQLLVSTSGLTLGHLRSPLSRASQACAPASAIRFQSAGPSVPGAVSRCRSSHMRRTRHLGRLRSVGAADDAVVVVGEPLQFLESLAAAAGAADEVAQARPATVVLRGDRLALQRQQVVGAQFVEFRSAAGISFCRHSGRGGSTRNPQAAALRRSLWPTVSVAAVDSRGLHAAAVGEVERPRRATDAGAEELSVPVSRLRQPQFERDFGLDDFLHAAERLRGGGGLRGSPRAVARPGRACWRRHCTVDAHVGGEPG